MSMPSSVVSVTSTEPTTYVTDASVFVRWYVEQDGWEHAVEVRDAFARAEISLLAPAFVRVEMTNVIRKVWKRKRMLEPEGLAAVARSLDVLGVVLVESDADGIARAARLAATHSLSMYDALYAELALSTGNVLLTADASSARALAGHVPVEVLRGVPT